MPPAGEGATASEAPGSFQARSRPPMYSRTDNALVNPFNRRLTAMLVTTEGVASTHRIGDSHFRRFPAKLRALFGWLAGPLWIWFSSIASFTEIGRASCRESMGQSV